MKKRLLVFIFGMLLAFLVSVSAIDESLNNSCNLLCKERYGTKGTCGGTVGDLMGSKYCGGTEQCVCYPPSCSSDNDCQEYNVHFKCEEGLCVYPDCNTACKEFYGYDYGSCGLEEGEDMGTSFCGYSFEQCKCLSKEEKCVDSDNGKNYYIKGNVTGLTTIGQLVTDIDHCLVSGVPEEDIGKLGEYYCCKGGICLEDYKCPNGCENGVCILPEPDIYIINNDIGTFKFVSTYIESWDIEEEKHYPVYGGEYNQNNNSFESEVAMFNDKREARNFFPLLKIGEVIEQEIYNGQIVFKTAGRYLWTHENYIISVAHFKRITEEKSVRTNTTELFDAYIEKYPSDLASSDFTQESECIDTDGKDYYNKGFFTGKDEQGYSYELQEEFCLNVPSIQGDDVFASNYLGEIYCENNLIKVDLYTCPNGCQDGICLKEEIINPSEETGPLDIPQVEKLKEYACRGCELDNKCYPFGYRKSGKYCSDSLVFVNQLDKDIVCDNNFECSSNVCVSGQCIDEGLIKKIINWFKRVFNSE